MKLLQTVLVSVLAENGWNPDFPVDQDGAQIKFLKTSKRDNRANKIKMEDWFKKESLNCKKTYDSMLPTPPWYGQRKCKSKEEAYNNAQASNSDKQAETLQIWEDCLAEGQKYEDQFGCNAQFLISGDSAELKACNKQQLEAYHEEYKIENPDWKTIEKEVDRESIEYQSECLYTKSENQNHFYNELLKFQDPVNIYGHEMDYLWISFQGTISTKSLDTHYKDEDEIQDGNIVFAPFWTPHDIPTRGTIYYQYEVGRCDPDANGNCDAHQDNHQAVSIARDASGNLLLPEDSCCTGNDCTGCDMMVVTFKKMTYATQRSDMESTFQLIMINTADGVHFLTLYDMEYVGIGEPIKGIFIGDSNFQGDNPRDNHCSYKYSYDPDAEVGKGYTFKSFKKAELECTPEHPMRTMCTTLAPGENMANTVTTNKFVINDLTWSGESGTKLTFRPNDGYNKDRFCPLKVLRCLPNFVPAACPDPDDQEDDSCTSRIKCEYDADYYDSRWTEPDDLKCSGLHGNRAVQKTFEVTVVVELIDGEPAAAVINGPGRDSGNAVEQELKGILVDIGVGDYNQINFNPFKTFDPITDAGPFREDTENRVQANFVMTFPMSIKDKITADDLENGIENVLMEGQSDNKYDASKTKVKETTPPCLTSCLGCPKGKCGDRPPPIPFDACCGGCTGTARGKPYSTVIAACCLNTETDEARVYNPDDQVCCKGELIPVTEFILNQSVCY